MDSGLLHLYHPDNEKNHLAEMNPLGLMEDADDNHKEQSSEYPVMSLHEREHTGGYPGHAYKMYDGNGVLVN